MDGPGLKAPVTAVAAEAEEAEVTRGGTRCIGAGDVVNAEGGNLGCWGTGVLVAEDCADMDDGTT